MTGKVWQVIKHDSLNEVDRWVLPGHYGAEKVEEILKRLSCTDLMPSEVLNACRDEGDPERNTFLDRIGEGSPLHYGLNPWYTAQLVDG